MTVNPNSRTCKRKVLFCWTTNLILHYELLWGAGRGRVSVCIRGLDPTTSASLSSQLYCTTTGVFKVAWIPKEYYPWSMQGICSIYGICQRGTKKCHSHRLRIFSRNADNILEESNDQEYQRHESIILATFH